MKTRYRNISSVYWSGRSVSLNDQNQKVGRGVPTLSLMALRSCLSVCWALRSCLLVWRTWARRDSDVSDRRRISRRISETCSSSAAESSTATTSWRCCTVDRSVDDDEDDDAVEDPDMDELLELLNDLDDSTTWWRPADTWAPMAWFGPKTLARRPPSACIAGPGDAASSLCVFSWPILFSEAMVHFPASTASYESSMLLISRSVVSRNCWRSVSSCSVKSCESCNKATRFKSSSVDSMRYTETVVLVAKR